MNYGKAGPELAAALAERFEQLQYAQASLHYRDRVPLKGPDGLYAAPAGEFSTKALPLSWQEVRALILRRRRGWR